MMMTMMIRMLDMMIVEVMIMEMVMVIMVRDDDYDGDGDGDDDDEDDAQRGEWWGRAMCTIQTFKLCLQSPAGKTSCAGS